jgi:hypothetical protein
MVSEVGQSYLFMALDSEDLLIQNALVHVHTDKLL